MFNIGDSVIDDRHASNSPGEVINLNPLKVVFNKQEGTSFAFRGQLTYTYEGEEPKHLKVVEQ